MTLKEVRDNVLRVLWLEYNTIVPSYIFEDVTTAINSALQLIAQSPLDYFRKEEVDITFGVGETEKDLYVEAQVSEIIGGVWVPAENNRELHRITDESEFNQFFQRFYGMNELDAVDSGVLEASYYMVKTRRSYSENSSRDSAQAILAIKPAPTSAITLRMLAAKAAVSYTTAEITNLVGTEVTPVPNNCVETIFLPIARWYAMRSHFFFEKEKANMFEQDATRAMQALQVSNPDMGTRSHMADQLRKPSANPQPAQAT